MEACDKIRKAWDSMVNQMDQLADELWEARMTRTPIPQPSAGAYTSLDVDAAYGVQTRNVQRRIETGEIVIGHKIGLTSLAMQRQLGVDQPDFGAITDEMVTPNGGEINVHDLIAPRIEAEYAFRIGRELSTSPTIDEIRAAIDAVAVSVEIIDSRVSDWKIGLVDTIADNASSASIVVGPWLPATPERLAAIIDTNVTLEKDGATVCEGPGAAVLGDPLIALHWLATAIGRYGHVLTPGETVLAGAVAAAVPLTSGSHWRVHAPGFEPATLTTISR